MGYNYNGLIFDQYRKERQTQEMKKKMSRALAAAAALMMLCGCSDKGVNWDPDDTSAEDSSSLSSASDSEPDKSEPDSKKDSSSEEDSSSKKDDSSEKDSSSENDDSTDPNSFPDDSKTRKDDTGLYDTTPISKAYLSGDDSDLDDLQKAILKQAKKIIKETVTDDMTPIEKELAIHDYISIHYEYDKSALDAFHTVQPHSDDPYGMLVLGRGICSGYSTSFKLLMDMIGIENMIVHATANNYEEHAWNMVKFDGEWYCVDVTWDDLDDSSPDRFVSHTYFNCTEQTLLNHAHQWDANSIPHASGTKYSFSNQFSVVIKNKDDLEKAVKNALAKCHDNIYVIPEGDYGEGSRNEKINAITVDLTKIVNQIKDLSGFFELSDKDVYSIRLYYTN